ncbi:MAG TPA: NADP-dependent oxidoreductase [Gammaproteobacteria bacterium]|nr:NADP-dependent oxidoreductase [Arenicellales bacterium]MDP6919900.1 NADP-dependent oxidoreductase [Arenicellales bacterium]HCX88164.1 NADP-dependent oxidoreductase [Gammaproteobacteria bacterium]
MTQVNRQIVLASRPVGEPKSTDFKMVESVAREPETGEVLCRSIYLSLDPYMRGRMSAAKSYAKPVEIGGVMEGGVVGEVLSSNFSDIKTGDFVVGAGGWQEYFTLPGTSLRKIDSERAPISTALGVLGMPGMTAYVGLSNIGKPQPGETVAVAAASGAVGSVVGQIAKIKGARAVGIAGSSEKCRFVVDELGFDDCINHRDPDFKEQLQKACPDGIDVYFENVGGPVFKAVLPLLNQFARVPVCGVIAHYNDTALPEGPDATPLILRSALVKRLTIRGFLVFDYVDQEAEALEQLTQWVSDGRLKYREDFVSGLEAAPEAFIGLLKGKNFGKLLVEVSPYDKA